MSSKVQQLVGLGAVLAVLIALELRRPPEYTLAIVHFEETDSAAALWPRAGPHAELARRLCGPAWAVRGPPGAAAEDALAFLFCGSLEDWLQNPQYVLEASVGRKVASMSYARFADVDGCGRLMGRLSRWRDRLAGRQWAALLELQGQGSAAPSSSTGAAWGNLAALVESASLCTEQRLLAGPVLDSNSGWRYAALRSKAASEPAGAPPAPKGWSQMVLEPP